VQSSSPDQVTVLVFKDNLSSRTFQVPLKFISGLGLALGAGTLITGVSLFLAVKYYYTARKADPSRVDSLQQEIQELKLSNQELHNKALNTGTATTTSAPPIQNTTHTESAPSTPANGTAHASLLPANVGTPPDPNTLPFKLDQPRATWQNKNLQIHFNIQYVKGDGGNQQGKIIVLASGPEALLTYPAGVLNLNGGESLIGPQNGEYFSVSRFREGRAVFENLSSQSLIKNVDILIFDQAGKLLLAEKLTPQPMKSSSKTPSKTTQPNTVAPEPAPPAEPASGQNDPGT